MANIPRPSLGVALLGKTREAVIGLLFSSPDQTFHVREVARRTGFSAPTVARELRLLEEAGVLTSVATGRQVNYRPNPACPLYAELRSIAAKTWGVRGRVGAAVGALADIDCAFIFGSFAAGDPHAASDVDLVAIGSLDFSVLSEAMTSVSHDVGRAVNAKLYRPAEWRRKLADGNVFIASVAAGPKLFVVGDEGVLNGIGEPGAARRTKKAQSPSAHGEGDPKPPQGRARVRGGRKAPRRS